MPRHRARGATIIYLLAILIVGILLVLIGRFLLRSKGGGPGYERKVPISLLTLKEEPFYERFSLLGEARSLSDSGLRAETDGVVTQILADAGDTVTAGQTLAILEGVEQRIALAEAQSRLAEAESRLRELTNGTRPEVLSQRAAENRVALAQQEVALSRLDSVKALGPQLQRQAEGDYQAALATEHSARDNLSRTQQLVKEGALSKRDLVQAEDDWREAKGALIRAEKAKTVQQVSNKRDKAQAQAQLASAKAEMARTRAVLSEARSGERPEVISAQREVVAAYAAARDRAQLELARTLVKAREAGTIRNRLLSVGDRASTGDLVFQFSGDLVEVTFDGPETIAHRVEAGQKVLVKDASGKEIEGKVVAVAQALDQVSRRQAIRVELPSDTNILPGAAVQGQLLVPVADDCLIVNRDALVQRGQEWVVFTVDEEQQAVEHKVEQVGVSGDEAAIRGEGLKDGTEVVGRGAPGLATGIKVLPPKAPTPSPSPAESKDS